MSQRLHDGAVRDRTAEQHLQNAPEAASTAERAANSAGGTRHAVQCCGAESAVYRARRVCDRLGIRHYTKNAADIFEKDVIDKFVEGYLAGETPNPCVDCNRSVKFSYLFSIAISMEADFLATGHYARIENEGSEYSLRRGLDRSRDQSYFLYCLQKENLRRILFPLGGLKKTQVRKIAEELKLPTAAEKESRGICFVPAGDYASFLRLHGAEGRKKGEILSQEGRILGRHDGIFKFTVGQRKGLGSLGPEPHYVISLDPSSGNVMAGTRSQAFSRACAVSGLNWLCGRKQADGAPLRGTALAASRVRGQASPRSTAMGPAEGERVEVQIRYMQKPVAAKISPIAGGNVIVEFSKPQFAVAPGQAAVFYSGDRLLGGGTIKEG
ncbi:MAG: tRNA 2-thiouridine(34) synthase MnmA [bacterium]